MFFFSIKGLAGLVRTQSVSTPNGEKTWPKYFKSPKMNFKVNITPFGIPIPTVPRVSDWVG